MKKYISILVCFLSPIISLAQNGADNRYNPVPYYSYKKGLGITSPDSIYQLNIRFRIQNRATLIHNNDDEYQIDGQIRRLRLRMDGYVGSPKFYYLLQLSFAPGDLGGEIIKGENLNVIRDAVVFYIPNKRWSIGFGQTKLPGNRQRFNSSGALQLTDRTINNAMFNIDRDFGLQVHWLNQYENRFSYNVKTAITTGEGRNFTRNDDVHLAYTGKVELFPLGSFTKAGEYFEGDLIREQKPKLMLSAAYQFNNKAKRAQGQLGDYLFDKRDLHAIFADLIFKYKGFAFMSAYMSRSTKYPLTFNPDNWFENDYVQAGRGMDFQGSYLFPNNYEVIVRYSWQKVDEAIHEYEPHTQQLSLGLTRYIWEHALKLQAEASYNIENFYGNNKKDNWYFRFQMEIGI